jgi:RNA-binding protein
MVTGTIFPWTVKGAALFERRNHTDGPKVQLTSKQRAHLRSLANPLKPVLQVGKEGVTDASVRSLEEALNTRELVKVKVQETSPQAARVVGESLAERLPGVTVVASIGRTAILYRPDPDKPEIRLP